MNVDISSLFKTIVYIQITVILVHTCIGLYNTALSGWFCELPNQVIIWNFTEISHSYLFWLRWPQVSRIQTATHCYSRVFWNSSRHLILPESVRIRWTWLSKKLLISFGSTLQNIHFFESFLFKMNKSALFYISIEKGGLDVWNDLAITAEIVLNLERIESQWLCYCSTTWYFIVILISTKNRVFW